MAQYWSEYLGEKYDYKIRTGTFYLLESKKKFLNFNDEIQKEPNSNYTERGLAYELNVCTSSTLSANLFFLDIDHYNKSAQASVISGNKALLNLLSKWKDVYIEQTLNGGIHILFCCNDTLHISAGQAKHLLSNKNGPTGVVFEFKQKCLVWPTAHYKAINQPTYLQMHTYAQILEDLDSVYSCFDSTNLPLVEPKWGQHIKLAVEDQQLNALLPREVRAYGDDDDDDDMTLDDRIESIDERIYKIFVQEFNPDMPVPIETSEASPSEDDYETSVSIETGNGKKRKRNGTLIGDEFKRMASSVINHFQERGVKISKFVKDSFDQDECDPCEYQANHIYSYIY